MIFQIVRAYPVYCQITDGLIGEGFQPLPMSYLTEAFARKLAGRMTEDNYQHGGDDHFFIMPYGGRPSRDRLWGKPEPMDDDIPF